MIFENNHLKYKIDSSFFGSTDFNRIAICVTLTDNIKSNFNIHSDDVMCVWAKGYLEKSMYDNDEYDAHVYDPQMKLTFKNNMMILADLYILHKWHDESMYNCYLLSNNYYLYGFTKDKIDGVVRLYYDNDLGFNNPIQYKPGNPKYVNPKTIINVSIDFENNIIRHADVIYSNTESDSKLYAL